MEVAFTPYDPKDEEKKSDPDSTREVDLKHHFKYNDTTKKKTVAPSDKLPPEAIKLNNEIKERLLKDNQLRSALNILKSLDLYSEFKQAGKHLTK